MKIINQVIVHSLGCSWLGFWTRSDKFNKALGEIMQLSKTEAYRTGQWSNAFWVLDKDGGCVAAQSSLSGAMRYYTDERVLVHFQEKFI